MMLVKSSLILTTLCLTTLGLAGCDNTPSATACTRDTDCLNGQKCSDGICTKVITQTDLGQIDTKPPAAEAGLKDSQVPTLEGHKGDVGPTCTGNKNDKIEREEMPIAAGTGIKYTVGTKIDVDLKGKVVGGRTQWDLTANAADDAPYTANLEPLTGWVVNDKDFKTGTYMALLDPLIADYSDFYGIFKATPTSLDLLGVGSKAASPNDNRVVYDTPIQTLRFPIAPGDSFLSESSSTGHVAQYPLVTLWNHESYKTDVLAAGDLKLPSLTLPVVLVRTYFEQFSYYTGPLVITASKTTFNFISECYGIVASVKVKNEVKDLGTVTAEERRRITQ